MSQRRYLNANDFPGDPKQGQCRVCCGAIPANARRRTTCSAACSDRMVVLCRVNVQVARVEKRDRGVCAICGWDTRKLWRILEATIQPQPIAVPDSWGHRYVERRRMVDRDTQRWLKQQIGYWTTEIDHIVPVVRGGGVRPDMTVEQVLANLRTLCHDCHARETARLAAERAEQRRAEKATLFVGTT